LPHYTRNISSKIHASEETNSEYDFVSIFTQILDFMQMQSAWRRIYSTN